MKVKPSYISIILLFTSLISFLTASLNYYKFYPGYEVMTFFPVFFMFLFFFLLDRINWEKSRYRITISVYILIQWVRYVFTPFIISFVKVNPGTFYLNPHPNTIKFAGIMMIVDLVISFTLISYFANKKRNFHPPQRVLYGNRLIYILYVIFALAVYLYFRNRYHIFDFMFLSFDAGSRVSLNESDTVLTLIRQIILIGAILLFLGGVSYCKKKYLKTSENLYYYIALIFSLINISIIIGESRTVQIYAAFISIMVLIHAFPDKKKKTVILVGGMALIILIFMSIYKFFYAFQYGSYLAAIQNSEFELQTLSEILLSYFMGPQSLAVAIEFKEVVNLNFTNLLFDFVRSVVPLSFLVKGEGLLTNQMFNSYIYSGSQLTGHLISSLSYGYLYFGILFSSLFTVLNITISAYVENKMNKTKSYEMMYVWGYILIRASQNVFGSTPSILLNASIMLITGGLLFKVAAWIRN